MDISKLSFTTFKGEKSPDGRILYAKLEGNKGRSIGIDPGVNYGYTYIKDEDVEIVWGKLPKRTERGAYGVLAYQLAFSRFLGEYGVTAIVEGAAYKSRFGQVGLEEVRFGFYLGLWQAGIEVSILPPSSVRKAATGSGKDYAFERWPLLNHNAADSVYCALVALERGKNAQ